MTSLSCKYLVNISKWYWRKQFWFATYGNQKATVFGNWFGNFLIRTGNKKLKNLSRMVHKTGLLDLLTQSGRPCTSRSLEQSLIDSTQLTNCQRTCELVFKPKADILNICCDCQFVFSVLDELYASHHAWCNRCCSKSAL